MHLFIFQKMEQLFFLGNAGFRIRGAKGLCIEVAGYAAVPGRLQYPDIQRSSARKKILNSRIPNRRVLRGIRNYGCTMARFWVLLSLPGTSYHWRPSVFSEIWGAARQIHRSPKKPVPYRPQTVCRAGVAVSPDHGVFRIALLRPNGCDILNRVRVWGAG